MKNFPARVALVVGLLALDALHAKEKVPPAPASAANKNLLVDGPAFVRDWMPPVYPADALKEKIGGRAVVRMIVDENGQVTAARVLEASDPRLGEAAVSAVKKWQFNPAIENEKAVAICMDVPLEFNAAKGAKSWKAGSLLSQDLTPRPAPRTSATPKNSPPGDYPEALTERRLTGRVTFACVVQPDGHATDFQILSANHADFVLPALAALARWEFTPASQGDLTARSELLGAVSFDPFGSTRAEVLAANAVTGPDGKPPVDLPLLESAIDPVWPYALLMEGQDGVASAEFTVLPSGSVVGIKIREASHPNFGHALAAAMQGWSFTPAMNEGRTVEATLVKQAEFKAVPRRDQAAGQDSLARLVGLARTGKIRGSAGLDGKITPLYRVPPQYPGALASGERPSGNAVIEFVIDRDGRARLPRIVSATHAEFGWAAATAVSQWIFTAPRRGGEPTEVRAQIPLNFTPPPL